MKYDLVFVIIQNCDGVTYSFPIRKTIPHSKIMLFHFIVLPS